MIKQAFDRDELGAYVKALRGQLGAPRLQGVIARAGATIGGAEDPGARLRERLPDVESALASSGGRRATSVPYLSRDPLQSLLQSALESKLREKGVSDATPEHRDLLSRIAHTVESFLHPQRFGPDDPDWVIEVGESMLGRLADGVHPFNPRPAHHTFSDTARIVVVGDWGTGLPRARAVAEYMADEVADALADGREAHVVHLGDVYYSGTEEEVRRNVLAPGLWPVTAEQAAAGVTSWSLNGNHEMYSGGFGYFQTLLADARFSGQRSPDGKATSFFRLTSPSWDIVALDTAWNDDPLFQGRVAVLPDPQARFVQQVAGESERKLMLMSHHQLISVYDCEDLGPELGHKLAPVLTGGRVTAWMWGHEHRCMTFAADQGITFPRCIGHGGVPVLMPRSPTDPVPAPGLWEQREFLEHDGDRWARFGFAVLDVNAGRIHVRYRDDQGRQTHAETIA